MLKISLKLAADIQNNFLIREVLIFHFLNIDSAGFNLLVCQKLEFLTGDRYNLFPQLLVIPFKAYLALGYELDALADNEIRFAFTTLMLLVQNSGNLAAYSGVDILAVLLELEIFVDAHHYNDNFFIRTTMALGFLPKCAAIDSTE